MSVSVAVYSQPGCFPCRAVMRALTKLGIDYSTVDVSTDDDALATVQRWGFTSTPVVAVSNDAGVVIAAWSGVRDDHMKALAGGTLSSDYDMRGAS